MHKRLAGVEDLNRYHTEEDLAEQIQFAAIKQGDREAFEQLFRCHYDGLLRFIWGYVNSEAVAEEIIQELFLKLWKHRKQLDISGSLKTYLYTAARNMSIDHKRHRAVKQSWAKEKKASYDVARIPTIDERLHHKMLLTEVKQAIQELPERRREVFMLSRYERMTYKEIAEFLDLSVSTVETQMSRALKTLRRKFGAYLMITGFIVSRLISC